MARSSAAFLFYLRKIGVLKFNLLPKASIEKFWEAMWLGLRPLLRCLVQNAIFVKLKLLPKQPIETFWDALWFGLRPILRFMALRLNLLPKHPIDNFLDTASLSIRPLLCFMVQMSIFENPIRN